MVEGLATIVNETGLHARPASQFIAFVNKYKADINIIKGDHVANAKSILNVLTLGLNKGSTVTIRVTGDNEETILSEILDYIATMKD